MTQKILPSMTPCRFVAVDRAADPWGSFVLCWFVHFYLSFNCHHSFFLKNWCAHCCSSTCQAAWQEYLRRLRHLQYRILSIDRPQDSACENAPGMTRWAVVLWFGKATFPPNYVAQPARLGTPRGEGVLILIHFFPKFTQAGSKSFHSWKFRKEFSLPWTPCQTKGWQWKTRCLSDCVAAQAYAFLLVPFQAFAFLLKIDKSLCAEHMGYTAMKSWLIW